VHDGGEHSGDDCEKNSTVAVRSMLFVRARSVMTIGESNNQ